MFVGPYFCVILGAAAIIEPAFQARQAAGLASEVVHVCRPLFVVIPGAAAYIERAFQVCQTAGPASEVVYVC
jgi:hypothetical protein